MKKWTSEVEPKREVRWEHQSTAAVSERFTSSNNRAFDLCFASRSEGFLAWVWLHRLGWMLGRFSSGPSFLCSTLGFQNDRPDFTFDWMRCRLRCRTLEIEGCVSLKFLLFYLFYLLGAKFAFVLREVFLASNICWFDSMRVFNKRCCVVFRLKDYNDGYRYRTVKNSIISICDGCLIYFLKTKGWLEPTTLYPEGTWAYILITRPSDLLSKYSTTKLLMSWVISSFIFYTTSIVAYLNFHYIFLAYYFAYR